MYQISTNTGAMKNFLNYLKKNNSSMAKALSVYKPGSSSFNRQWKRLAESSPQKFAEAQHNFIKSSYFDPAVSKIKKSIGFDITRRSKAVQDALWSTAVQHGSGGANTIFKRALGSNANRLSDREIIERIYNERAANNGKKYFSKSSSNIRAGVVKRFAQEKQDALASLRSNFR